MAKNRTGLHKEVSSIFDGVPLPKKDATAEAAQSPRPVQASAAQTGTEVKREPAPKRAPTAPPQWQVQTATDESKEQVEAKPATTQKEIAVAVKETRYEQPAKAKGNEFAAKAWAWVNEKILTPAPGGDPKRHKIMVVAIPILLVGFILSFGRVLGSGTGRRPNVAEGVVSTASSAAGEIKWQVPEPYPTTLRDPMQIGYSPGNDADAAQDKLPVKGIVYSEDNCAAIIGSQIVKQGEKVGQATVTKINKDSVEFEMNGKTWSQKVEK